MFRFEQSQTPASKPSIQPIPKHSHPSVNRMGATGSAQLSDVFLLAPNRFVSIKKKLYLLLLESGDTIRFVGAGLHQAAVYKVDPETTRQDVSSNPNTYVDTSVNGPFDEGDIGDTNNRIALAPSPRAIDRAVVNRDDSLGMNLTIMEPRRYLVICAIRSHFLDDDPGANGGMFGFIDVR